MRKLLAGTLMTLVLFALPMAAGAQQLFDFNGQALLPGSVGGALTMYSEVFDPAPATTPLPLDFADYQYTLVIEGLTLDSDSGIAQTYSGGTLTLYQDAGTAADYANPATFTDGEALLIGTFTTLTRTAFPGMPVGINGTVDWTGGTHLDDFAPSDQTNWSFLSGASSAVNDVEPGYDENWDGKVEPKHEVVPNTAASFGAVKALFK
jgi:hypothetical protein